MSDVSQLPAAPDRVAATRRAADLAGVGHGAGTQPVATPVAQATAQPPIQPASSTTQTPYTLALRQTARTLGREQTGYTQGRSKTPA